MLIPTEHDRSSCNDSNLDNASPNSSGYVRCVRCALLKAQADSDFAAILECRELIIDTDAYHKYWASKR